MENKLSKLGLWCYTLGGAIGAGLFVTLPAAIESTGLSIILAIIVTSILCFFAYFYCVAITSVAPVKGGDYGCISFVAEPLISGVFGITTIFYCISNCTYATGALDYLSYVFPFIQDNIVLLTVLLITVFIILDSLGAAIGGKVATVMTITLTACIVALIVVGLPAIDFSTAFDFSDAVNGPFFKNGFTGFSQAIAYCIWVVGGIGTTAVTFCRNVKNPTKSVPQAIIVITLVLGVIACLLCLVCATAVPIDVATQGLGAVAMQLMPKALFYVFAIGGGAFSLLTSLQAFLAGYREGILEYAEQGFLPKFFTKKLGNGIPWVVILFIWLLSVVPYVFGITLDTIVAYTGAPVYFCLVYVNIKCMKLPEQYPETWKKSIFRNVPMSIWKVMCGFSALCAIYLVYCYCAEFSLLEWGQMALTIAAMFAWAFYRMKAKHVDVEKMEKERQELIADALAYTED